MERKAMAYAGQVKSTGCYKGKAGGITAKIGGGTTFKSVGQGKGTMTGGRFNQGDYRMKGPGGGKSTK